MNRINQRSASTGLAIVGQEFALLMGRQCFYKMACPKEQPCVLTEGKVERI